MQDKFLHGRIHSEDITPYFSCINSWKQVLCTRLILLRKPYFSEWRYCCGKVARYIIRASSSRERMTYMEQEGKDVYDVKGGMSA